MKTNNSKKLFEAALRVMPGGVNSPVRAFKAVGALPHFIARARGAKLYDADGNAFVGIVMSGGTRDRPGPRAALAGNTYTAPYNDIPAVERLREARRGTCACVIVEPVAGKMGGVPPHPDFLNRLRDLTHHYRIVLVFDEV